MKNLCIDCKFMKEESRRTGREEGPSCLREARKEKNWVFGRIESRGKEWCCSKNRNGECNDFKTRTPETKEPATETQPTQD